MRTIRALLTPETSPLWIQLFARLATIPSLEALSKKEKHTLVKEAERAGMTTKAFTHFRVTPPVSAEATQAWGIDAAPSLAWEAIWIIHPWAKRISDLLDEKTIELPSPYVPDQRRYRFMPSFGALELPYALNISKFSLRMEDVLLKEFIERLEEYPFPYRRCPEPECKAVFVFSDPRRKYCSPACQKRSNAYDRRKDSRREYMRKYMADRRQNLLQGKKKTNPIR
jgi:hypothetical protein